ncbi:telomere-associated protein Tap [Streptomyces bacillaris]|uniref:telomere-associated protein Tap n=1 Tax=Streptomyces bacillaris TaxID=68179 RepID=UPI0036FD5142
MRDHEDSLFARVDALLESLQTPLPPPDERARLRQRAHLTTDQLAQALQCEPQDVEAWETGASEPQGMQRAGYARLLSGLQSMGVPNHRQPATTGDSVRTPQPQSQVRPPTRSVPARNHPAPKSRFPHGPLAVIDQAGEGLTAHFADQTSTDVEADHLVDLIQWALSAGLGHERLHPHGKDADPLLVLTPPAMQYLGLPPTLEDRVGLRLPDSHPQISKLQAAGFKLTRSGFGPWTRTYLPVKDGKRACVQLALTGWGALSERDGWRLPSLPPGPLARLLGTYADRVITPTGSTAVCGQEVMTALRPPTRAERSPTGAGWVSAHNDNALSHPLEPAPCEAHDAHRLAQGRLPEDAMHEEAWDWSRIPTDSESTEFTHVVGLDINLAFVSVASSLVVGLNSAPRHVTRPHFDPKIPGAWLCDFSDAALDPRLPSPFTPTGQPPIGPAWYATPTLQHATQTLKINVQPLEAYLRDDSGRYLDPWNKRLSNAYKDTMAEAGIHPGMRQDVFLHAMQNLPDASEELLGLLAAIKATGKGGIGKLREGPRGTTAPYQPWPALNTPTWRPDIRAAVISRARTLMHSKMLKLAALTGRYPLAVLSDCVIYPAHRATALDVVPTGPDGQGLPGTFRLGVSPGYVKQEGTQPMDWHHHTHAQGINPARYIKDH